MDILIPFQFEKDWHERVCPALEALGVPKGASFESVLGELKHAEVWPLRIEQPAPGSVVPVRWEGKANSLYYEDLRVHLDRRKGITRGDSVIVKTVYGMMIQAIVAESSSHAEVQLDTHFCLAVSTEFITFVADILPGKDAFVVVGMWPNVMLPLFILKQQNHSYVSGMSVSSFRWIKKDDIEFEVTCSSCKGKGQIDCKKCEAKGTWQPAGKCEKCLGVGTLRCHRCGGSGDFIGKYGDRMGDCRSCSGTGSITCFKCKGSGEPPILDCKSCEGKGYRTCRKCSGNGTLSVHFQYHSGSYGYPNERFVASDISGRDVTANVNYSLNRGAQVLLEQLAEDFEVQLGRQRKTKEIQSEISKIRHCLDRAMEVGGVPEEMFDRRLPPLGVPKPTTERMKNYLVLAFPLLKLPAWARAGDCPIPSGTSILLLDGKANRDEIEIPRTGEKSRAKPVSPLFIRMEILEKRPHFLIGLPEDVATDRLPDEFFIKVDVPPPSEMAQKKELDRWCSTDGAPELLETLSTNLGVNQKPPRIITDNKWINPSQQEALDWIMAGVPLVLVKGPPGTGKTTVITEAVLQSLRQNEKVLVCSETHQAVENVLERLHRDGGIRMIRHGRADQSKLSSLGRDYLEVSSKQAFVRGVADRVSEYLSNRNSEVVALKLLHAQSRDARQAAVQLANERRSFLVREKNAKEEHSSVIETAHAKAEQARQAAEQAAHSILSELAKEQDRAKLDLEKQKKKLASSMVDRDRTKFQYFNKTGKEPDPNFSGSASILRKFASLGINKLASPAHLNERFVLALAALKEAETEIKRLDGSIQSNCLEIEVYCEKRDDEISRTKAYLEDELHSAQIALDDLLRSISVDVLAAESKFLPPQQNAAETCHSIDAAFT